MMKNYHAILIRVENKTAFVTINREDKLNALNAQTLADIASIFDDLEHDSSVRGIVITGSGTKAFIAGADISEFQGLPPAQASALAEMGHIKVMDRIANFPKPVIAAINGFALGGGLELAMACHIRVAAVTAKLGLPEVSLGIIPGYGGTQRLTQLVGRGKALEMIMTADMLGADEALKWGLVNDVVLQEDLLATCVGILEKTYLRSPLAISYAIEAVNEGLMNPLTGYSKEIELFGKSFGTAESEEGIKAFIEKRKPSF